MDAKTGADITLNFPFLSDFSDDRFRLAAVGLTLLAVVAIIVLPFFLKYRQLDRADQRKLELKNKKLVEQLNKHKGGQRR